MTTSTQKISTTKTKPLEKLLFDTLEDIKALALPVLRHRIITNFHANAENIDSDEIIKRLLDYTKEDWVISI